MKNKVIYNNLLKQYDKLFRHLKAGSFKTRERYGKAFKRFLVFAAEEFRLQKLSNISPKHIYAYVDYMKGKGLSASTVKTDLAAIRLFHDQLPQARYRLPSNADLSLERRKFGGVDRTWSNGEFVRMQAKALALGEKDYLAILTLGRYMGLRLEECFRIDTNDAHNALKTGLLRAKGKNGLIRPVPINESIRIVLRDALSRTHIGCKLFVSLNDKTHLAMKRVQSFIGYHRRNIQDAGREHPITHRGLRHTYAHEQYEKFVSNGHSPYEARKMVSALLGHQRDDVTRIYLAGAREEDDDV